MVVGYCCRVRVCDRRRVRRAVHVFCFRRGRMRLACWLRLPLCRGRSCIFYQAEDGIRDGRVTGVQTCALPIYATASVGIALGDDSTDPEILIRNADAAMYRAKETGRARYELFDDEMRMRSVTWLETEGELRRGLDNGELHNVYQPIVSPTNGEIVGFEALVRWHHPERGVVSPIDFIPVAEQSGLIVPLGRAVLERACAEAAGWNAEREGQDPLRVAVNFSPKQLSHPGAVDTVTEALEASGLPPELLCVEITESALVEDASATLGTLSRLKEL